MSYIDAKYAFTKFQEMHEGIADPLSNGTDGPFDRFKAADESLSRRIWDKLQLHYKGHPWHVGVEHRQGMAHIKLPTFSEWGYWIKLSELASDPKMNIVLRGAGELLERLKLPRAGFDVSHYVAAQKRLLPMLNINKRLPD